MARNPMHVELTLLIEVGSSCGDDFTHRKDFSGAVMHLQELVDRGLASVWNMPNARIQADQLFDGIG